MLLGLWLACAAVLLAGGRFASAADTTSSETSWLGRQWRTARAFWERAAADLRWKHLPGSKLTAASKHALWDEALRHALADGGLGAVRGEIRLRCDDPTYAPSVAGLSIRRIGGPEIGELAERDGQLDYFAVDNWYPGLALDSLKVSVGRRVALSAARSSRNEIGCSRSVVMKCGTTWGEWVCETERARDDGCGELAYDARRWRELQPLEISQDERYAMWNAVLELGLRSDDWLGEPDGTITLESDGLDPGYRPEVEGMHVELRSRSQIEALADARGRVEFVRLRDHGAWYRGPASTRVWLERTVRATDAVNRRSGAVWSREIQAKCEKLDAGWSCATLGSYGSKEGPAPSGRREPSRRHRSVDPVGPDPAPGRPI